MSASSTDKTSPTADGFADSAWVVKPSKVEAQAQSTATPEPESRKETPKPVDVSQPTNPQPSPAPLTGALQDMASLSLATPPLQPLKAPAVNPPVAAAPPNGGINGTFTQTALQGTAGPQLTLNLSGPSGRSRPVAPPVNNTGILGIPPPPISRPASVPSTMTTPLPMMPTYTGIMNPAGPGFNHNPQMGYPMMPLQQPMNTGVSSFGTGMQMQPTGLGYQATGYGQPSMSQFQYPPQQNPMQPQMTGMSMTSMNGPALGPFMGSGASVSSLGPSPGGINSVLPAPLIPQQTAQPLKPQPTGPPPPVRFGVQQRLKPQPTGKADLSKASKFTLHLPGTY